jgi:TATA-binding protein-associated factor Taf7
MAGTFTSRLVDLPTIMESHKTIDKTADICQLLICKEGDEFDDEEDANSPVKKKDPNKEVFVSSWHWTFPEKTIEKEDL